MQKEQIQEFTRRISTSNRTGLVVVTYDIFFAYLAEAKCARQEGRWDAYKQAVRQATKCISELMETLDFSYGLAAELYRTYVYCREILAVALYKRSEEELTECENLMKLLYDSFVKIAEADDSEPIMKNTEQVYVGYTYGRNDVNSANPDTTTNRGFLA